MGEEGGGAEQPRQGELGRGGGVRGQGQGGDRGGPRPLGDAAGPLPVSLHAARLLVFGQI